MLVRSSPKVVAMHLFGGSKSHRTRLESFIAFCKSSASAVSHIVASSRGCKWSASTGSLGRSLPVRCSFRRSAMMNAVQYGGKGSERFPSHARVMPGNWRELTTLLAAVVREGDVGN